MIFSDNSQAINENIKISKQNNTEGCIKRKFSKTKNAKHNIKSVCSPISLLYY